MTWSDIFNGFQVAALPMNLLFCFLGVLLGRWSASSRDRAGGCDGPSPSDQLKDYTPGYVHHAGGIYYGSMYGGSTTSILVSIPGEPASVMTCVDGHQMALQEGQDRHWE